MPNSGGLDDQPVGLVARMTTVENVYDAIRAWRGSPDWVVWRARNPDAWRIVETVIEIRQEAEKNGR